MSCKPRVALVPLAMCAVLACGKDPPAPKEAAGSGSHAAPNTPRRVGQGDPATLCDEANTGPLPLLDRPLFAKLAGKPLALETPTVGSGALNLPVEGGGALRLAIRGIGRRSIVLSQWPGQPGQGPDRIRVSGRTPEHDRLPQVHAATVELAPMAGGKVAGSIFVCLSQPGSFIAGTFQARVNEDISDAPDPTRDHFSTLRYLANEHLISKGADRSRLRHRWPRLDVARGVAQDHVLVYPKGSKITPELPPQRSHTFVFVKKDGRWTVDRMMPGDKLAESRLPAPTASDRPEVTLIHKAARAAWPKVQAAAGIDGGFASRMSAHRSGDSSTVTFDIWPDDARQPQRWVVHTTDGGATFSAPKPAPIGRRKQPKAAPGSKGTRPTATGAEAKGAAKDGPAKGAAKSEGAHASPAPTKAPKKDAPKRGAPAQAG